MELYDEKAIIELLVQSDPTAFEVIFNRHKHEIFTYCFKFTKRKDIAEELVQDVFETLWLNKERLNADLSVRAFLYTMAKNKALNFLKRAITESKLHQEVFNLSPKVDLVERQLYEGDTQELLQQAIEQLPSGQRTVFLLSRIENKTHNEIATYLSISKNTVKDQISKALKSIKHYFIKHGLIG